MSTEYYPRTSLIGGGAGALDQLASANLDTGDVAHTTTSTTFYVHHYDAASAAGESSPNIIAPDDIGVGNGRWILVFSAVTFAAQSVLAATAVGVPAALTIAEDRLVGRIVAGDVAALTPTQVMAMLSGEAGAGFDLNGQALTSVGAIGCGTITTTGNLVLPANGVVGVTDGNPQIVFDNANNWLEITATKVGINLATPTDVLEVNSAATNAGITIRSATDNAKLTIDAPADEVAITQYQTGGSGAWNINRIIGTLDLGFYSYGTDPGGYVVYYEYATGNVDIVLHDGATVGLKLGGTLVTATAAEINQTDGNMYNFTETLAGDHTYQGIAITGTAGENLLFGYCVHLDDSGLWVHADANDTLEDAINLLGIVLEDILSTATGKILLFGIVRDDSLFNFDEGEPVWLSTTEGRLTLTKPVGSGEYTRMVGRCIGNSDTLWFNPSMEWEVIP